MSEIHGTGYGDSHLWKRGETRQYGSIQNELRGTRYTCQTCRSSFFYHYNMFRSAHEAIKAAGVDDKCSSTPNLLLPAKKRLEQLQLEMAIVLKPVAKDEYDCLQHVRKRLLAEICAEIQDVTSCIDEMKSQ